MKLLHQESSFLNLRTPPPPPRSAKITSCLRAVFWINCAYLVGRKKCSNNQTTGMIMLWSAGMRSYVIIENNFRFSLCPLKACATGKKQVKQIPQNLEPRMDLKKKK